jgi:hypothetical protein
LLWAAKRENYVKCSKILVGCHEQGSLGSEKGRELFNELLNNDFPPLGWLVIYILITNMAIN